MAQACPLPRTLLLMFEGGGLVRPGLLPAAGAAASAGLSLGAGYYSFLGANHNVNVRARNLNQTRSHALSYGNLY